MPGLYERLDDPCVARDVKVLVNFVAIFCREKHQDQPRNGFPLTDPRLEKLLRGKSPQLCADCTRLLQHGMAKRLLCPQNPKPTCRKCATHCYAPGYRERIREVMKSSGRYLVTHGRLDLLRHYIS